MTQANAQPTQQRYIPGTRILDYRYREVEPEVDALGFLQGEVRAVDQAQRTVEFVISTGETDRYKEIVDPTAFDQETIDGFMANPVMLAGHQHVGWGGEPTIIGHWLSVKRGGQSTVGVAKLANTDLANTYWQLILDGALRACSIGFIVREWEMREVGKEKMKVRVFTKIDLIEVSLVAVPANRGALMKAAGFADAPGQAPDAAELTDELKTVIQSAVRDEIAKQLNTDPGGPAACLIQDVVEACQATRDHHHGGVTHEAPTDSNSGDGPGGGGAAEIESVIQMLRGMKPKA